MIVSKDRDFIKKILFVRKFWLPLLQMIVNKAADKIKLLCLS